MRHVRRRIRRRLPPAIACVESVAVTAQCPSGPGHPAIQRVNRPGAHGDARMGYEDFAAIAHPIVGRFARRFRDKGGA